MARACERHHHQPQRGLAVGAQPCTSTADKRTEPRKVRFTPQFDRLLHRSANVAGMQYATFLHELIVWAVDNGACDAIAGVSSSDEQNNNVAWRPYGGAMHPGFDFASLPKQVQEQIEQLARQRGMTLSEDTQAVAEEGLAMRLAGAVKPAVRKPVALRVIQGLKRSSSASSTETDQGR